MTSRAYLQGILDVLNIFWIPREKRNCLTLFSKTPPMTPYCSASQCLDGRSIAPKGEPSLASFFLNQSYPKSGVDLDGPSPTRCSGPAVTPRPACQRDSFPGITPW